MSDLYDRIELARRHLGLSYADLGELFGISGDATRKAIVDRKSLRIKYLELFVNNYNISRLWLNSGQGEMYNNPPEIVGNIIDKETGLETRTNVFYSELKEDVSEDGNVMSTTVRLIKSGNRNGFIDSYYADGYLKNLPVIFIEKNVEFKGEFIAFEVYGDGMEPEYLDGDIVICNVVKRDLWKYKLHREAFDYFIAHGTKGIFFKQIKSHDVQTGEILCHSLNDTNSEIDFTLNLKEVIYLYRVIEHRREVVRKRRWWPKKEYLDE